jgi:CYTH domain-containing protein
VEQGGGPLRREAVEEAPRALFEALWPLTEGRRLASQRWEVEDGRLTWTIDQLVDRDLVLAEVALPAGVAEVTLPEWLRPLVVREVTDDAAYASESLALRSPAAPATPAEGLEQG